MSGSNTGCSPATGASHSSRLPRATPWDGRVEAWENVASSPVFSRLATRVLELAAIENGDRVVDLGAGTGLLTLTAARTALEVIAVDYSQPMLDRLAEHAAAADLDGIACVRADLREVPIPDGVADIVVSSYAFHHIDDAGKALALTEARRILRPGGRLVILDMMFGLSLRASDRRIIAAKVAAIARKGPAGLLRIARNVGRVATRRWEHPTSPERWQQLLEARRFVDVHVEMIENEAGIAFARRPLEGRA